MRSTRSRFQSVTEYQLSVAIGLVAAVWAAAVSRWVVSDLVVPWDSKNQFYAFFRFLSATLRAGDWPFWNPYHYGGHPSIADPQSLVFNPVFVIWGLLDPHPTMRAFDLVVFAHLLAGGIGIVAIGWRARWPIPANVLGCDAVHVRRRGVWPAPAYRCYPRIRVDSAGAVAPTTRT